MITSSNYSKNVVKAFSNYLTTNKSDKLVIECLDPKNGSKSEVIKQYKRYMQPKSINNNLLKKLIENKRFNPHFLYFLKYYSFDYLNNSKSENRYNHIFYVIFLIRCYSNKSNLQVLIAYKKQKAKRDFWRRNQQTHTITSPLFPIFLFTSNYILYLKKLQFFDTKTHPFWNRSICNGKAVVLNIYKESLIIPQPSHNGNINLIGFPLLFFIYVLVFVCNE